MANNHGRPLILVGVKLGQLHENMMAFCIELAQRTKANLKLVHFCEPWNSSSWIAAYPEDTNMLELTRFAELKHLEFNQGQMNALVESLPKDLSIQSRVIFGSPIEGLHQEAKQSHASLMVCGSSEQDSNFLLSGFSTAIGLMASSSIPVLVVPEQTERPIMSPEPVILICDDMSEQMDRLIPEAVNLARMLSKRAKIVHLNVCSISDKEIENLQEYVAEAMSAGIVKHDPNYSARSALKQTTAIIEKRLRERFFHFAPQGAIPEERYQSLCVTGGVVPAILRIASEVGAEFIVLGKHEFLHQKPFKLGKVPFRSMLGLKQPILLVPPS